MSQSLFSVGMGLSDDNIFYLSGSGAPVGTTGDVTFDAPVGSYYSNYDNGVSFKKVANNGNAADWQAAASTADTSALQAEVDAVEVAAGLNADGTFASYTGTNYLNAATSLKNADVLLDAAVKTNANAIAAEYTRAVAAEDVITVNLASEVTRATTAEAALASSVTAEATARAAADATLASDLAAETAARIAADAAAATAVADAIAVETAARQAADTAETTARQAADATLTSDLAAEVAARIAADSSTGTALAAEVAARQAADAAETTARQAADATLTSDLAAEVAARIAADTAEAAARGTADTTLQTNLDTEAAARVAGDAAEAAARAAADATLTTAISTEATARTTADTNLQTQIDAMLGGGGGVSLASLQTELDLTQASAGVNADGSWTAPTGTTYLGSATSLKDSDAKLDAAIAAETAARVAGDAASAAADTAEATARAAADTTLTTNLAAEIARAEAAEAAEAAARVAGDAALQVEVDAVEVAVGLNTDGTFAGFSGTNFLNSATTIKAGLVALDSQVNTNTTNIATLNTQFAGIDAALQAELDRLEAATGVNVDGSFISFTGTNYLNAVSTVRAGIVALDGALKLVSDVADNEVVRATAAEGVLTTNLATEVAARTAADTAIQAELDATQAGAGLGTDGTYTAPVTSNYLATATTLKGADSLLDSAIKTVADSVASMGAGAITTLTADLAAETAARIAGDNAEVAARSAADTAETAARVAADTANASAIASEVTRATAAETANTDAITAEVARATAAEAALASSVTAETAARTAADATLTTNLAAEVTRATDAEAALTAAVAAEAAARAAADTTLTNDLAAEATRATAAEAANAAAVVAETTRATAAEAANTASIVAEVARATAAEAALTAADTAETAARIAADSALAATDAGLAAYVGKGVSALPQYTSTSYVATNDDLTVAVGKLDAAILAVSAGTNAVSVTPNVTVAAVVDAVSTKTVGLVKWLVYVQAGASKQAVEVLATHDGSTVVDATTATSTVYAKLRMGAIAGLSFDVSVSGVGAGQQLNLVVSSNASATIRTVREVVSLV